MWSTGQCSKLWFGCGPYHWAGHHCAYSGSIQTHSIQYRNHHYPNKDTDLVVGFLGLLVHSHLMLSSKFFQTIWHNRVWWQCSENDETTINDSLWSYKFFALAGQLQVLTPLGFSVISPGAQCVVSPPLSFHHSPHSMHLLSQSLDCMCRHSCVLPIHICTLVYTETHVQTILRVISLFLIPADSQGLKAATLLLSYKMFVRICFFAYSPYQLIETVKRVSLRGLVTQGYPDACQHCHVIWLVSAQASGLFPF